MLFIFQHINRFSIRLRISKCNQKILVGDAGYRSPYLSHAKRALYHLSYIPCVGEDVINKNLLPLVSTLQSCAVTPTTNSLIFNSIQKPSIAQLVERWTVDVTCGNRYPWFKSGSKDVIIFKSVDFLSYFLSYFLFLIALCFSV